MFFFDVVYSNIFTHSPVTTKVGYINSKKDTHFNLVFIGSSRVANHIVPSVFEEELNLSAINFGVMDARPKDMLVLIKALDTWNITYDTLYVQLDYYYNSFDRSNFMYYEMLPYTNLLPLQSYFESEHDNLYIEYVPFYKYAANDSKLGVRALVKEIITKESMFEDSKGFVPLYGTGNTWKRVLPDTVPSKGNPYIATLKAYSESHKLNVKFFVAPFREDVENLRFIDSLKVRLPDLINFSTKITQGEYFKNGYHLNNEGAMKFSKLFAKYLKEK
ncbi:hypothetical protein SAMN05216480_11050 [Pustulibacterium marinum]|uniref:Uncharacterized protein n=1 Tax=Pustulibacterium marinum TaxID=1224947 RepID=A0A1I7HMX6_9FLAO|nr:hypothetical protein [Pustulibacterium marinum]SFU61991.1 hypothetical protein SAMN05216480_11050 [Pustulibacterium marinum]